MDCAACSGAAPTGVPQHRLQVERLSGAFQSGAADSYVEAAEL
jgi:hypothetical protein